MWFVGELLMQIKQPCVSTLPRQNRRLQPGHYYYEPNTWLMATMSQQTARMWWNMDHGTRIVPHKRVPHQAHYWDLQQSSSSNIACPTPTMHPMAPATPQKTVSPINIDSPNNGSIRNASYVQLPDTRYTSAITELKREQEAQKTQMSHLENRVKENTSAINEVRTDVRSLISQQTVQRRMSGSDRHLPGRLDSVSKGILRGCVRKPTVDENYFAVVVNNAGDQYDVQDVTIIEKNGRQISFVNKGDDPEEAIVTLMEPEWI